MNKKESKKKDKLLFTRKKFNLKVNNNQRQQKKYFVSKKLHPRINSNYRPH